MTKKEMFNFIATEMASNTEVVEFCNHEIELLNKKSSKSTQTKTQKENELIKPVIVSALAEIGKPVTVTEMINASADLSEYSVSKMSALLKQLVESGKVTKAIQGKKSLYSVE